MISFGLGILFSRIMRIQRKITSYDIKFKKKTQRFHIVTMLFLAIANSKWVVSCLNIQLTTILSDHFLAHALPKQFCSLGRICRRYQFLGFFFLLLNLLLTNKFNWIWTRFQINFLKILFFHFLNIRYMQFTWTF